MKDTSRSVEYLVEAQGEWEAFPIRCRGGCRVTRRFGTRKRPQVRPETRSDLLVLLVVGTGVDPVTFRFSDRVTRSADQGRFASPLFRAGFG